MFYLRPIQLLLGRLSKMLFTVGLCTVVTRPLEIIVNVRFCFCVCFISYVSMKFEVFGWKLLTYLDNI